MLEVLLLVGLTVVMHVLGAGNPVTLAVFLIVVVLCLPMIRLMRQMAPPFVPTPMHAVRRMIDYAAIKPGEHACDLGCGDGRIVRLAAARGAQAVGHELSLPTYMLAKLLTIGHKNAAIRFGDFWQKDLRGCDIIFCFLLKEKMREFHDRIWPGLKPGTRVVSYMFRLPGVTPAKEEGNVRLYIKT